MLTPIVDNGEAPAGVTLDLVEWRSHVERHLYRCGGSSFPLSRVPANVQAPGFHFTGYLKSEYVSRLNDQGTLDLAEMDPTLAKSISEARTTIRDHFKARAAQNALAIVEEWKKERVYPFEGEPQTTVASAERQVFDIVAVTAARLIPNFQETEPRTKRFHLRMLRQAVERGPSELREILTQVLDLPFKKQEELAKLLERTTLSSIIGAARLVTDRLRFIDGLEQMLFEPELKQHFKERRQLHRILAEGSTWIFGEEFALTVDDKGLSEVLRQHLKLVDRNVVIDEPVRRLDGSVGIVDLVISRRIPGPRETDLEHLVIELKAPKISVGSDEITQIKSYAFAVAEDQRFRHVQTRWSFWLVANEIDQYGKQELRQHWRGNPGLLWTSDDSPNMRIWVKTWAQLVTEARARLMFLQKELNYTLDRDESLKYLHESYSRILGSGEDQETEEPAGVASEPAV